MTEAADREECAESTDGDAIDERSDAHLEGLEEGAGCTEIWEHLAHRRDE